MNKTTQQSRNKLKLNTASSENLRSSQELKMFGGRVLKQEKDQPIPSYIKNSKFAQSLKNKYEKKTVKALLSNRTIQSVFDEKGKLNKADKEAIKETATKLETIYADKNLTEAQKTERAKVVFPSKDPLGTPDDMCTVINNFLEDAAFKHAQKSGNYNLKDHITAYRALNKEIAFLEELKANKEATEPEKYVEIGKCIDRLVSSPYLSKEATNNILKPLATATTHKYTALIKADLLAKIAKGMNQLKHGGSSQSVSAVLGAGYGVSTVGSVKLTIGGNLTIFGSDDTAVREKAGVNISLSGGGATGVVNGSLSTSAAAGKTNVYSGVRDWLEYRSEGFFESLFLTEVAKDPRGMQLWNRARKSANVENKILKEQESLKRNLIAQGLIDPSSEIDIRGARKVIPTKVKSLGANVKGEASAFGMPKGPEGASAAIGIGFESGASIAQKKTSSSSVAIPQVYT